MKQQTKNQHIIPQVHLRSFLDTGQKRLACLNVEELRLEKTQSPKSICSAPFYYSKIPGVPDEYGQKVENALEEIEDWYGKSKEKIEEKLLNEERLSDNEKYELSVVISNFIFRGNRRREEMLRMTKKMLDDVTKKMEVGETINGISIEEAYKEAENTSYITDQAFRPGFANTLTHKKWEVLINNSESIPFITADEAVVEYVPEDAKNWPMFSTSYAVLTQLFHLSPKIAILINFQPDKEGEWEFSDITNTPKIIESNYKYIDYANKYAYSNSNDFFKIAIDFENNKIK